MNEIGGSDTEVSGMKTTTAESLTGVLSSSSLGASLPKENTVDYALESLRDTEHLLMQEMEVLKAQEENLNDALKEVLGEYHDLTVHLADVRGAIALLQPEEE